MAENLALGDELSEQLKPLRVNTTSGNDCGSQPEENLCCICQEVCVNPVQLPCSHIFCFLCIKGVAARSNHCALCRHKINLDVLDNPTVVNKGEIQTSLKKNGDSHKWYYEAKNGGWWLYEQRTSSEIEKAFKDSKETVRLQISGFYYVIDFRSMVQFREEFPSRRRRIKRDKVKTEAVKGVAGIVVKSGESEHRKMKQDDRCDLDSRWQGGNGKDKQPNQRMVDSQKEVVTANCQERDQLNINESQNTHLSNELSSGADFDSEEQQTRLVTGHD